MIKRVLKSCFSDISCFWEDLSYGGHIGFGVNVSSRCAMSATSEAETASEKPRGENFNDEMKVSKFRLAFS